MVIEKKDLENVMGDIRYYLDENGIYTRFNKKIFHLKSKNKNLDEIIEIPPAKFAVLYQGVDNMLNKLNPVGNHYGSVYAANRHFEYDILSDNGVLILKNRNFGINNIQSGDFFYGVYNNHILGIGEIDDIEGEIPIKHKNLRGFPIKNYMKFSEPQKRNFKFDMDKRLYFFDNN